MVILVFRTYPGFPDLILVFLKFNKKSWLSWFFGLILVFRPLSWFFCPCPGLSCKQMIFLRCRMIFLIFHHRDGDTPEEYVRSPVTVGVSLTLLAQLSLSLFAPDFPLFLFVGVHRFGKCRTWILWS